ncbi:MAG: thioredoxin-disulfide reductase [Eubacteriales bacterium]|nr:thioredoxin-disulfide reductase [Eubacteriales bacterium]
MSEIYDLIIIGSGPAGLAAAIYAERAKLSALVIEKEYISGGQVVNTYEVDNYPGVPGIGGFELGMKFREHADGLGAKFLIAEVQSIQNIEEKVKTVCTDNGNFETKAIILATGAKHRDLGVPGEKDFAGQGVSYCATCDGAFFKGRTVVVVGGGDVAVEDALFLARGCEKVYLVHRRDSLRAARRLQEALFAAENVEVIWNTIVTEICGDDHVEAVWTEDVKTGERKALTVDGVFVAVGMLPNSSLLKGLVEIDEQGYVAAGENCETNVTGVLAAGDVRTKSLRQIVTAAADGANAVNSVQNLLVF